jgi:2Fe-2S ferredoxin
MPSVTFVSHTGATTTLQAANGMSVMRAAVMNGVDGIDAECGGSCACATCHVIVDEAWASRLPAASEMEKDTMELLADPTPTSRLSCQLKLTEDLDGLVVHLPASQG